MLNTEIPSAGKNSIRAGGWDWNIRACEVVLVDKYMHRIETMKQSGPWSGLGTWSFFMAID